MAWIDKSSYIQNIADKLAKDLHDNGWKNILKYRVTEYDFMSTKFGEVRLFRSVGSDGQIRNLGIAYGYDTNKSQFNDQRIIFAESPFGYVGTGDGITKVFYVQIYPIDLLGICDIYINGSLTFAYTIDKENGKITFNDPPANSDIITATYQLSRKAPDPPTKFIVFTYNTIYLQRIFGSSDPITKIGDGDGVTTTFYTPTFPIKEGTLKVYVDGILIEETEYTATLETGTIVFNTPPTLGKEISVEYVAIIGGTIIIKIGTGDGVTTAFNTPTKPIKENSLKVYIDGIFVESTEYTANLTTGQITFNTAPVVGAEIKAEYVYLDGSTPINDTTTFIDDISVDSFDPLNTESLMSAVYSSLYYLYPSPPTVISFTSEDYFGRAWQKDSYMYYWGNINKDRIILFFRPDPTGGTEQSYFAPLYVGKLMCFSDSMLPRKNMVIIGGCRDKDKVVWAVNKKLGIILIDYGPNTSNGNQTIQLQQSVGGSYYQSHYLAFITHDKAVDSGDGRFNPSQYSGKYHLSQFFIVHPNDGFVGMLDDVFAIHPKNIVQNDELEIDETVTDEEIGVGDGITKKFYVKHKPVDGSLNIKVDCTLTNDYVFDPDLKIITFNTAPIDGAVILASYRFHQIYRYTLPSTPISPFCLESTSPFVPIGIAILKENKN